MFSEGAGGVCGPLKGVLGVTMEDVGGEEQWKIGLVERKE